MRLAESVTFGGSGLNRAAELRGDATVQAELLARGQVLPIWRGKPLLHAGAGLGWVGSDSVVLHHGGPPVFLGFDADQPCFAVDISGWLPEAGAEAVQAGFLDQSEQHHPGLPHSFAFTELRAAMLRLTAREAELAATAKAVLQWHRSHGFCAVCGTASRPVLAGWQRSCPACGAQHFPRTDPVVIMLVTHGNRALIG
ncbi:MAG: NAD(+) diphosphatase, partial [Paracoccaceae bacterium]